MGERRLEVEIYQITDDAVMKQNRTDGSGWEWGWADWQRDWMDATPSRFAYRCLPLTIANQTGWWIKNPVGFTAVWRGRTTPGSIDFRFDAAWDRSLIRQRFRSFGVQRSGVLFPGASTRPFSSLSCSR